MTLTFWEKDKIAEEDYALEKNHKNDLKNRFVLKEDEWLNRQTSLEHLKNIISFAPFGKYNFIIFQQDFNNEEYDSVTMYRVIVSYIKIQFQSKLMFYP